MQEPKIAVVLSGCGAKDGSEIHEAVLTLLALDRAGACYECLAPNIPQTQVVNMVSDQTVEQAKRNVLEEAARIARGKIRDIAKANPADYAALIFPGGYGAALNLCNFSLNQDNYTVQKDVLTFAKAMVHANKPIGFICIAPVLAPKIYGPDKKIKLTIGNDPGIAKILETLGAIHIECKATACIVDNANRIVSTPAYMRAHSIKEVAMGIECLVKELLRLLK